MRTFLTLTGMAVLAGSLLAQDAGGQKKNERDIFNLAAQKAAGKDVKKIVFIGDRRTHGARGNHEFVAGPIYMARTLHAAYPNCYAVVTTHDKFPTDLSHAD